MNNGKMFDLPPKCPGMLTTKLTGLFGWRHTYRVHHRQKGINHFNQNNLQKTYSLNLPSKKLHEASASNPSLPEASSTVNLPRDGLEIRNSNELSREDRSKSFHNISHCFFML
jgi:hypothetical protein